MNNKICPRCGSDYVVKNGYNASGTTQYKCKDCGRSFTGTRGGKPGRPRKTDKTINSNYDDF